MNTFTSCHGAGLKPDPKSLTREDIYGYKGSKNHTFWIVCVSGACAVGLWGGGWCWRVVKGAGRRWVCDPADAHSRRFLHRPISATGDNGISFTYTHIHTLPPQPPRNLRTASRRGNQPRSIGLLPGHFGTARPLPAPLLIVSAERCVR